MASPGSTRTYRSSLLRASNHLTEADVSRLSFLCGKIPPAKRVTNGITYFTELESLGLLSEQNVTTLIQWMDELELAEASKPLKEYQRNLHTEAGVTSKQKCSLHQDHPLTYVCLSCDTSICSECRLTSHKPDTTCDVIRQDRIADEATMRGKELWKEIERTLSQVSSREETWEEKKERVMSKLNTEEQSDLHNLVEEMKQIQQLRNNIEFLKKAHENSTDKSIQGLRDINGALKQINEIKRTTEKQRDEQTVVCRRTSVESGIVVGSVSIHETQIVTLFDERRINGGVLLVCVDPDDPTKEYWRYTMKIDDHAYPVVMSYVYLWYDGMRHPVFAIGKKVYIVNLHYKGGVVKLFRSDTASTAQDDSVTLVGIESVPAGSWITSITCYRKPGDEPEKEFLLSFSGCSVLRMYNVLGSLLRTIEIRENGPISDITCVACNIDTIAIIDRECADVILLSLDGTLKQYGPLRPPTSNLSSSAVVWTGKTWLVLCINDRAKQWEVVHYRKKGKLKEVCVQKSYSSNLDVPVSVTKQMNTAYVTFSNKTICTFELGV